MTYQTDPAWRFFMGTVVGSSVVSLIAAGVVIAAGSSLFLVPAVTGLILSSFAVYRARLIEESYS